MCLKFVKSVEFRQPIYFKYGTIQGEVDLHCNLPKCIDSYSPACVLVGHIGKIEFFEPAGKYICFPLS